MTEIFSVADYTAVGALVAAFVALHSVREQRTYAQRKLTFEMVAAIQDRESEAALGRSAGDILLLAAADWNRVAESPVLVGYLRFFNAIDTMALASENGVVDRALMQRALAHFAYTLPFYQLVLESIEAQTGAHGTLRAARQFLDDLEEKIPKAAHAANSNSFRVAIGNACASAAMRQTDGEEPPFPVDAGLLDDYSEESDLLS